MTLTRYSNSSHGADYDVDDNIIQDTVTQDALDDLIVQLAYEYGHCDGGEVITLYSDGQPLAQARWTPEDGGKYYACTI